MTKRERERESGWSEADPELRERERERGSSAQHRSSPSRIPARTHTHLRPSLRRPAAAMWCINCASDKTPAILHNKLLYW